MDHEYTPPQLDLVNSDLDVESRYLAITSMLAEYKCIVEFTKVNGEERSMECTLREDFLPVQGRMIVEDIVEAHENTVNHNLITVWSTEANNWRAMRTMNIKSVKIAPLSYTLTVQEDPETGEAVLEFPPQLLEQVGWKEGDTLNWEDNKDGSWSLSKKEK